MGIVVDRRGQGTVVNRRNSRNSAETRGVRAQWWTGGVGDSGGYHMAF